MNSGLDRLIVHGINESCSRRHIKRKQLEKGLLFDIYVEDTSKNKNPSPLPGQ